MEIKRLAASPRAAELRGLAELLRDAIAGNASVGFVEVPGIEEAEAWWSAWLDSTRVVFAAAETGVVLGTVSLVPSSYPNGRHRAEIAKLLVLRAARRRGIARGLMAAAEAEARALGRTTLTLDTETGSDAEVLYRGLGWTAAGSIPKFCYGPDGRLTPTTYYYKHLDGSHGGQ